MGTRPAFWSPSRRAPCVPRRRRRRRSRRRPGPSAEGVTDVVVRVPDRRVDDGLGLGDGGAEPSSMAVERIGGGGIREDDPVVVADEDETDRQLPTRSSSGSLRTDGRDDGGQRLGGTVPPMKRAVLRPCRPRPGDSCASCGAHARRRSRGGAQARLRAPAWVCLHRSGFKVRQTRGSRGTASRRK